VRLKPAPSFAWPPHADAVYYDAVFLRNGKAFYHAETSAPRVRLPAKIRFPRGSYRWIVRPAIVSDVGIQLGNPIVDSTFQVSGD
jgi:hypothetical protein